MIAGAADANLVRQPKGFLAHDLLAELMETNLIGHAPRIEVGLGRAEIKRPCIARSRIVQIEKKHKIIIAIETLNPPLCRGHFRPMRLVAPVAVVVVWNLVFAAGTALHVVHVHDRHHKDAGSRTECRAFLGGQPFDQPAAYPTAATFPRMLPGLNPDRRPFTRQRGFPAQRRHRMTIAALA